MRLTIPRTVRALLRPLKPYVLEARSLGFALLRGLYVAATTGRTEDRYCISAFYLPRKKYEHFDASTSSEIHQDTVYSDIKELFAENHMSTLMDIGCGTGFKLMKYFGAHDTLGLERPPVLDSLRQSYPDRKWQLSDFDAVPGGSFDMVICVDVIEHLPDPDQLMRFISKVDCKLIALSTPDRSRLTRQSRIGPPHNRYHMREWRREEFVRYVSKYFEVMRSNVVSKHEHYVICRKMDLAPGDGEGTGP